MGIAQDPNGGVPRCIASCIGTFLGMTEEELLADDELRKVGHDKGDLVEPDNKILKRFGYCIQKVPNQNQGDCLVLACHPSVQTGHCFLFHNGSRAWDPTPNNAFPWANGGWKVREIWEIRKIKQSTEAKK